MLCFVAGAFVLRILLTTADVRAFWKHPSNIRVVWPMSTCLTESHSITRSWKIDCLQFRKAWITRRSIDWSIIRGDARPRVVIRALESESAEMRKLAGLPSIILPACLVGERTCSSWLRLLTFVENKITRFITSAIIILIYNFGGKNKWARTFFFVWNTVTR